MHTETSENFTYWKRPWQKWLVLIAGILQIISLWLNIQEYKDFANVKDRIFSSAAWDTYAVQQSFQCAMNGFIAASFIGVFLIGTLARSQKVARMAESVLLLVLALIWGIVGFALQIASQSTTKIIWGLLLIVIFSGSIYTFWKGRNS